MLLIQPNPQVVQNQTNNILFIKNKKSLKVYMKENLKMVKKMEKEK